MFKAGRRSLGGWVGPLIGLALPASIAGEPGRATFTPSPPPTPPPERRAITETDLFRFAWPADPQVSPDGSRVAFVKVTVDRDRDDYDSSVWVASIPAAGANANAGEPRRLTLGPRDTWPRWSPDGSRLAFVRRPEADGKVRPPQVYLLNLLGGEARPLTDLPEGATGPAWSPDGRSIAFLSVTSPEDLARLASKAKGQPIPRESDVRVVTRAEFRLDNGGYRDPRHPAHVWAVSPPSTDQEAAPGAPPTPRRVTSGPFDEADPTWSPDSKRIYFVSGRDPDPAHRADRASLYAVSAEGGAVDLVAHVAGTISSPSPRPDGKLVAFRAALAEPPRSYNPADLFVVDVSVGPGRAAPRNLTAQFDRDVGGNLASDQHPPRGSSPTRPAWIKGGSALVDKVTRDGRANLEAFDLATGDARAVTAGDLDVTAFHPSRDGKAVVVLSLTTSTLPDLFLADPDPVPPAPIRRVTDLNARFRASVDLPGAEEIRYRALDGREIAAWVYKPPGFDPSRKYPLIVDVHGGPHAAYGTTFTHEFHWLAARGYVVLAPNPRGSSSYGEEFGNAIQHRYPGDDFEDIMSGVDDLIRRGYVDPKKLGITGGSGGGLLTNWAVTHTDRFAAAVAQRSIADWAGWWYSADLTLFRPTWFKDPPFRDPAEFLARSPIAMVEKVSTPLMLIEGEADLRTPPAAGGEAMFRALKFLKRPTVLIRFPGEGHDLSRSGKPWHRVERLQHIVGWFDRYLLGKPAPQYDPPPEG